MASFRIPRNTCVALAPAALALALSCGKDGGDEGAGTGTDSGDSSADPSSNTTPTTVDDSATTNPDDTTATSADTTDTDVDTTDTGMPACPYTPVDGMPALALQQVANGFDRPVLALGHPTELDRLFVVEQGGAIRILEPGETSAPAEAFLQIDVVCADNTSIGCEQGLLGFAFHPDFPDDGRIYIAYTPDGDGQPTRVSEFQVMAGDPDQVDMASERIVIDAAQPAGNHNGGMIGFGPDGYLYIGLGDGGNSDDQPQQTGRNPGVILAKILRIDPEPDGTPDMPRACNEFCDTPGPFDYTIPADNPFVGDDTFAPEIWAWGFRNPWRFAWDATTGDLYVADVGQGDWEEIDVVTKGGDYGWSTMEGNHCFEGATCDEAAGPGQENVDGMTAPIAEYSHDGGCSVTGGAVYRSCEVPAWDGLYVYADYCTGELNALAWDGSAVEDFGFVLATNQNVLGNGWNAYGDVFITTVEAIPNGPIEDGFVYRLAPE
jgi:glucose/arabinose dehydrogenase